MTTWHTAQHLPIQLVAVLQDIIHNNSNANILAFIGGSSVSPLNKLPSSKSLFLGTPEAEGAFQCLKEHFPSTPILVQPDTAKFVLEVCVWCSGWRRLCGREELWYWKPEAPGCKARLGGVKAPAWGGRTNPFLVGLTVKTLPTISLLRVARWALFNDRF